MSRHARIEEVEESDSESDAGEISDPSEDDIDEIVVSPSSSSQAPPSSSRQSPSIQQQQQQQQQRQQGPPPAYAGFPALYPVYFDKDRSRAEGRRVAAQHAVANPLAREIVAACAALGLRTVFEPTKTHPKDWANPGRVKVDLKGLDPQASPIKGKHHLYLLVARHLAAHPTTERSAGLREGVRGAPPPPPADQPYPRPAVPRGWKMPALVPYLSPAMTGGGVSENLFQDVMKEMQGQGGPGGSGGGMPGLPGMGGADMQRAMAALAGGGGGGGALPSSGGGSDKKGKKGKGKA